jgi:hypothetical protein
LRDKILTDLFKSDFMENLLTTITSNHPLKGELKSELFLILCEMPVEKIESAYNNKWLNYLCVSIVKRQYHSSTSKFHKLFRKQKWSELPDIVEQQSDYLEKEEKLKAIEDVVEKRLSKVDKELFKIYFKMDKYDRFHGELRDKTCDKPISSLRKIEKKLALKSIEGQKKLSIDHSTVGLSLNRSIEKIKKIINDRDNS